MGFGNLEKELFTVMDKNIQNLAVYVKGTMEVQNNLLLISQNKVFLTCVQFLLFIYILEKTIVQILPTFFLKRTPKNVMLTFGKKVKVLPENGLQKSLTNDNLLGKHV